MQSDLPLIVPADRRTYSLSIESGNMSEHTPKRRRRFLLPVFAVVAIAWPPVYSLFVHSHFSRFVNSGEPSVHELEKLLDAKRYTLLVPSECDGWYLALETVVDGVVKRGGLSTVHGGSEITLLIRRARDTRKIEYCWFTENRLGRGILDDPIRNAGITLDRRQGVVRSGDWLLQGGRTSIHSGPDAADFEVRVRLTSPHDDADA